MATHNSQAAARHAEDEDEVREEGEEKEEESERHPLVPSTAVRSIMDEQQVHWPERNSNNSKLAPEHGLDVNHARTRVLVPAVGQEEADIYKRKNCDYKFYNINQPVQVGRWRYGVMVKEDRRQTGKTRASWFRILARDVPNFEADVKRWWSADNNAMMPAFDPTSSSTAAVLCFAQLTLPNWRLTRRPAPTRADRAVPAAAVPAGPRQPLPQPRAGEAHRPAHHRHPKPLTYQLGENDPEGRSDSCRRDTCAARSRWGRYANARFTTEARTLIGAP